MLHQCPTSRVTAAPPIRIVAASNPLRMSSASLSVKRVTSVDQPRALHHERTDV